MFVLPEMLALGALGSAGAAAALWRARNRLLLSRAKHPSLAGHARIAKRIAQLLPHYEYAEKEFFDVDGAPEAVAQIRRAAFYRLSALFADRFRTTAQLTADISPSLSDLQFTSAYRVPFQFSSFARRHLKAGAFVASSAGVTVTDLDGNSLYDLSGSYGVNVFGYDFYKQCIERGAQAVRDLGPVLGPYHPVMREIVPRLREISGMDEISFHMSGTEAVMQAVRLARYHTGRRYLVRFCGAYHGWWGDVQPGIGNPLPARDTLTLRDMHESALKVLKQRRDIACVLVNPLQALHPNQNAPSDSALIDGARRAGFDKAAYADWLRRLKDVCAARNIILIFDEVFLGFRLARGGAQEYFGVTADMVTYGKTLGGGLPVGVLCGKTRFMKRYRDDRPADVCFARGTFNSHPYVLGAMAEFLRRIESPVIRAIYRDADEVWNRRAHNLNARLEAEHMPLRVEHLSSVWTVCYTQPSCYHWMLQYYLRAEGLALSWVGTGRFIFSLDYTDEQFEAVADRILAAARAMKRDEWWWTHPQLTGKQIRRNALRDMLRRGFAHRFVKR
jgi:glutamate-1-semialdehyde 2,1-aminomutase